VTIIGENQGPLAPHLYDVLAFTAHEVRALTYAAMVPGESYTPTPLYKKVMSLQGDSPAWKLGKYVPYGYCEAFAQYGLVTEESVIVKSRSAQAYVVAEKPRELILPFVGHLLDISLNEDQSLIEIFGPPQTSSEQGTRTCQRRLAVLGALEQTQEKIMPLAAITTLLGIYPAQADMIAEDLAASEVVNLKSSGRGQPTIIYMAKPDLAEATFRQDITSALFLDIVSCIVNHFSSPETVPFTNAEVADRLLNSTKYEDTSEFRQRISAHTFYLAKQRDLLDFKRKISQSDAGREVIWATEKQRQLIGKVLKAVQGVKSPSKDYLEEGQSTVEAILGDKELVNYLVAKAKQSSLGRKVLQEAQEKIQEGFDAVLTQDTWLNRREIQAALADHDIVLDVTAVKSHLKSLVGLGRLAIQETREGYKYSRA